MKSTITHPGTLIVASLLATITLAGCRGATVPRWLAATMWMQTGRFDGPVTLEDFDVDQDAAIAASRSSSDWRAAEVIPTPPPQREIVAEVVPTPLGIPVVASAPARGASFGSAGPPAAVAATLVNQAPAEPVEQFAVPAGLNIDTAAVRQLRRLLTAAPSIAGSLPRRVSPVGLWPVPPSLDLEDQFGDEFDADATAEVEPTTEPAGDPVDLDGTIEPVGYTEAVAIDAQGPAWKSWPRPEATLFVTGQQHGYIEPCGCTGLANQRGGLARRMTALNEVRDAGWDVLPIDAGNLVRRYGAQSQIKYHRSIEGLRMMDYSVLGFGPDDIRVGADDLLQEVISGTPEDPLYVSANVVLVNPEYMPTYRVIKSGGVQIGVTTVLDPAFLKTKPAAELTLGDPITSLQNVVPQMIGEGSRFNVVSFFGTQAAAKAVAAAVPDIDLMILAGGFGEPTYAPAPVPGTDTQIILTGNKGMYAGVVGVYDDLSIRYERLPLSDRYEDAPEMRQLMADYQHQLKVLGLGELVSNPEPHPSGQKFVGAAVCGSCHTTAMDIWSGTPHAEATESLVHPGERGDVPRHFDPECLSCHVTGWNPQQYYPYVTGYLDLQADDHLTGNGCENCHGPGAGHSAAEAEGSSVSQAQRVALRESMKLPLESAREKCLTCHDLDNSPDFHEPDAFDDYWSQVEHYGLD